MRGTIFEADHNDHYGKNYSYQSQDEATCLLSCLLLCIKFSFVFQGYFQVATHDLNGLVFVFSKGNRSNRRRFLDLRPNLSVLLIAYFNYKVKTARRTFNAELSFKSPCQRATLTRARSF